MSVAASETTPPITRPDRQAIAFGLPRLLILCLGLLPLLSVFSGLAAAPFGVTLCLITLAAGWKQGWWREVVLQPLFLGWLAFSLMAAISLFWASQTGKASFTLFRLSGLILMGLSAWWLAEQAGNRLRITRAAIWKTAGLGLMASLLLMLLEWALDGLIVRYVTEQFADPPLFTLSVFNRALALIALLVWPVSAGLRQIGATRLALCLLMLTGLMLIILNSASALLGFTMGGAAWLLTRWLGRKWLLAPLILLPSLIMLVPVTAPYWPEARTLEQQTGSLLSTASVHRLYIWEFSAEKALEKPWLGWGFAGSRYLPGGSEEFRPYLQYMPLHPHNLILQTWLELGIPGLLIFAAMVIWILYSLWRSRQPEPVLRIQVTVFFAYFTISMAGFGSWQNWWVASAICAALLCRWLTSVTAAPESQVRDAGAPAA